MRHHANQLMLAGFLISAVCVAAILTPAATVAGSHEAVFDEREKEAIESIVTEYLLDNPEIIMRVLLVLQEREQAAKQAQEMTALSAHRDALERDPNSPTAGNPDADVTIVEFFDYRCPYCKRVGPLVRRLREEDDHVRIVYKEWPILGPESLFAARAALSAHAQGKYLEFHEKVMGQRQVTEASVLEAANEIGLDMERFRGDMDSPKVRDQIRQTMELARSLGLSGTPAFVIGNRLIRGATDYNGLVEAVAEHRKDLDSGN